MAKKTKKRQIFEKAYLHFKEVQKIQEYDKSWYQLTEAIETFIKENPHQHMQDAVIPVMSAMYAIISGASAEDCGENCKGGNLLFAIYSAGRWDVLHDQKIISDFRAGEQ